MVVLETKNVIRGRLEYGFSLTICHCLFFFFLPFQFHSFDGLIRVLTFGYNITIHRILFPVWYSVLSRKVKSSFFFWKFLDCIMTPGIRPEMDDSENSNTIRGSSSLSGSEPRDTSLPCHANTNNIPTRSMLAASPKSADTLSLSQIAEAELEELYQNVANENGGDWTQSFPVACRAMLLEMGGNSRCLDCSKQNPEWAAVSYGAMVCLQCAGSHRSLGVNVSTVRSVTMDHWRYDEVVKMLEGGNRQLSSFFQRHALGRECVEFQSPLLNSQNIACMRYKTKAALFYRQQLDHHVQHLLQQGPYKGRQRTAARTKRRPIGTQVSNLE